jgi:hypothetical protein
LEKTGDDCKCRRWLVAKQVLDELTALPPYKSAGVSAAIETSLLLTSVTT